MSTMRMFRIPAGCISSRDFARKHNLKDPDVAVLCASGKLDYERRGRFLFIKEGQKVDISYKPRIGGQVQRQLIVQRQEVPA